MSTLSKNAPIHFFITIVRDDSSHWTTLWRGGFRQNVETRDGRWAVHNTCLFSGKPHNISGGRRAHHMYLSTSSPSRIEQRTCYNRHMYVCVCVCPAAAAVENPDYNIHFCALEPTVFCSFGTRSAQITNEENGVADSPTLTHPI